MSKLTDFRKAVNAGRKNLEKVKTISEPKTITFFIPDAKGVGQPSELEYCLKALSVVDMYDQYSMQSTIVDDKEVDLMSSQAAMVIVGIVDKTGKRIFSPDDAGLLDCPLNTKTILSVSMQLMANAGVDSAGSIEVK